jgi:hypothetical protein
VDDERVYMYSIGTVFLDTDVEDDDGVGWGGMEWLKSVWSEGCRFNEGRSSVLTAIFIQVGRRDVFRIGTTIDEAVIVSISKGRQAERADTDEGSRVLDSIRGRRRWNLKNVEIAFVDVWKDDELRTEERERAVHSKGELGVLYW